MKRSDTANRYRPFRATAILSFLVCLFVASMPAHAQGVDATVNGAIKDQAGALIPGVTVTLIDRSTGREVTATTNPEGFYVFQNVRPATYSVIAQQTGFKRQEVPGVKVDVSVPTTVNFDLVAGGLEETVTVSASDAAVPINSTNGELSTTVQQQQINDLPLNGRNPLALAGLQAGVSAGASNRTATINGLRGTFSNLTWDGININDNFIRTDSLFGDAAPSVPGVAEFTLITQNAGPGDALGVSQVKLITPRGGNEYHGSVFEYHRNDAFDANSFFNNAAGLPNEKLIRNEFGFNVGGPFALPRFGEGGPRSYGKDKLFFYAYYEGTIDREDESVTRTVLTGPARQGLFTYQATNGTQQTVNLLTLSGLTRDSVATSLINLTPLPNDLTGGDRVNFARFRFNTPSGSDQHLWGFRTDYDLSSKNRFEVIFSQFHFSLPNDPFNAIGEPFPGLPGGGQRSVRPRLAAAWNWTPESNFNNELRGGLFKNSPKFFTNVTFDRGYLVSFTVVNNAPFISNAEQNFLEQGRKTGTYELMDNAGWSRGNHFIRFGANYRLVKIDPFNAGGTVRLATLGFNDVGTFNPLRTNLFPGGISTTDFNNATNILASIAGPIQSVAETFNATDKSSGLIRGQINRQSYEYWNVGPYIGDTWRFRPNLTFNLGLRYEFVSVPLEKNGLLQLPIGGLEAILDPNARVDAASGGGRPLFNNDMNNFAPSFSFAWDPFSNGKTSIRGAYGISYVIDNNITTIDNAASRGFSQTITLNSTSGTLSSGVPSVPIPSFSLPQTSLENFRQNNAFALFTFDPNLRVPYVQQWNFGVQREILSDTVFEVRYVGNRGTKLTRAIDVNQQRIFANGFFQDFQRAMFNFNNCGGRVNPTAAQCANRQPLQLLPSFGSFALNQATFLTAVRQGEPARALDFYITNKAFFFAGFGGEAFGSTQTLNPYLPNPSTYVADYVGNGAYSNYNALQAEVRRRYRSGFDFQANYTWSKSLTDYEGSSTNFLGLLDLTLGDIVEKRRANNDLTHAFKANAGYELPFGHGKRWFNGGALGAILGGVKLTGIFRAQSGRPISFVSARGTLNRTGRSGNNTVDSTLTLDQLQNHTGLFFDPQTGAPMMFDAELVANRLQLLTNPAAGTVGSLQLTPVTGPGYWNLDMGLIKRTTIKENMNIEFRVEAFNVFNHTNFFISSTSLSQNINNATFGQITETFDPRIFQFALKFNF
jgi:Carboxypeptidase regulatory-like domain